MPKIGFPQGTVVRVEEEEEKERNFDFWTLLKIIEYQGDKKLFQIPEGYRTDFASVPKFLTWFIPRYGKYTKAAILHDYLWGTEVNNGMSYLAADNLFRQAMQTLNVSFLQRWLMWTAVRLAAVCKSKGWAGARKEIPRFLVLLVFGLITLVIPSIPILIARVFFYVLEWIIYVPLRINYEVRKKRAEVLVVNKPRFSWKLETLLN